MNSLRTSEWEAAGSWPSYVMLRGATGWSIDELISSPRLGQLTKQLWVEKARFEREWWAKQEKDYWEWVDRFRGPIDGPQFKNIISTDRAKKMAPWLEAMMPLVMQTLRSL